MQELKIILKKFLLFLYEINFFTFVFYCKGLFFLEKARTPLEIYEKFYLKFLKIKRKNCKIIKITKNKIVTRCNNPCPILGLANFIEKDTKEVCKKISEPVCVYVLKKMNKKAKFFRNYKKIRPHAKYCEETILLK
ncbi:MAG: hypothetical protein NZ889_02490 [Candidatus Pacearchaeota archaeon]|nr:hypothetical protein [Candidatus Pacearchaeota archaeon]